MGRISFIDNGHYRKMILIDGEFVGALCDRDVAFYSLEDGCEISDEQWRTIEKDCILNRGKKKALDLLLVRQRTEWELRRKLHLSEYTDTQVDTIVEYIKQFPYLDDVRYGVQYIYSAGHSKSRRELEQTLLQRGLTKEDIADAFVVYHREYEDRSEVGFEGVNVDKERERIAASTFVRKRLAGRDHLTAKEQQKLYAALARKGFSGEVIREVLHTYGITEDDVV